MNAKDSDLNRLQLFGDVVYQPPSKDWFVRQNPTLKNEIQLLPSVDFSALSSLPDSHGIYFATCGDNSIAYIGKAEGRGFRLRWLKHHKLNKLQEIQAQKLLYFEIKPLPYGLMEKIEGAFIWYFQPTLNTLRDIFARHFAEVFPSVGNVSTAIVREYIESQTGK